MTLCAAFPLDLCDVSEESPEESEESAGGPEHIIPDISQREGALIRQVAPSAWEPERRRSNQRAKGNGGGLRFGVLVLMAVPHKRRLWVLQ